MTDTIDLTAPDTVVYASPGDEVPLAWTPVGFNPDGYQWTAEWRTNSGPAAVLPVTVAGGRVSVAVPSAVDGLLRLVTHQAGAHRRTMTVVKVLARS